MAVFTSGQFWDECLGRSVSRSWRLRMLVAPPMRRTSVASLRAAPRSLPAQQRVASVRVSAGDGFGGGQQCCVLAFELLGHAPAPALGQGLGEHVGEDVLVSVV